MKIEISIINNYNIAEITADQIIIHFTQDVLDLMANIRYMGANRIIIHERNIIPDFFNLKTGIAGEILQKFSNYNMHLAIVGDFSKYPGNSLRDFIRESNKIGRISFVNTIDEARIKLTSR